MVTGLCSLERSATALRFTTSIPFLVCAIRSRKAGFRKFLRTSSSAALSCSGVGCISEQIKDEKAINCGTDENVHETATYGSLFSAAGRKE